MIATLMMLAFGSIGYSARSQNIYTPMPRAFEYIECDGTIVLLILFVCSVVFSLKGDKAIVPQEGTVGIHYRACR